MLTNLILNTDSYKLSHFLQYPPATNYVNSYIASRGSEIPNINNIVNFGLQVFLQEYLTKPITIVDVEEADWLAKAHGLPFNTEGWKAIVNKHGGYLPLMIEAIPEGAVVPLGTVQAQVRNTDPAMYWLVSYMETALLRAVWYPSTVATISRQAKCIIYDYLNSTCDDPASVLPFRLHDFGARGVSSKESAGLGGLAHLVNFQGTDTIEGLLYAYKYYAAKNMPGFSIPAAEHSTITSWPNEIDAYQNMLNNFAKPGALVAVVSDSYDIYNACEKLWGTELREQVKSSGACVVVRPDSGDPVTVVSKCIEILGSKFGFTLNQGGCKVLHPSIRLIQGDGVNLESISKILYKITSDGWSAENIAFGMGGALLQKVNRDTFKYAMKASAIRRHGSEFWQPISKNPVTDPGKKSLLGVQKNSAFVPVFENGRILKTWNFDEVRENARLP